MAVSPLTWLVIAVATVQVAFATYAYYPPCEPPHTLDYGEYGPIKDKYPVGSKIEYRCNDGYVLYGKSWTVCKYYNRKSSWTHQAPVCKPIKCRDLDDIRYGGVTVTEYKVGSRASYYCNKGYKLVGDAHRVCLKTGYWGGKKPVCKPIYCGKLDHIEYGGVKVKSYTVGSKAFFYCNKGYKLYGEPHRVCEYDGQWGGEYPVCKPIKCGDLDHIQYGGVRLTTYTVGSKAHFYCNKGYKLYGEPWRQCLYNGHWGGKYPVCKPVKCGDLDHIQYGRVEISTYTYGSKAHFYCNEGYKLYGDAYRVCQHDGKWGGVYPVCKPIKCPELDDIEYGGVRVSSNKVGSRASYYCNKGYKLVGDVHRVCLKTGYWGGMEPVCKPVKCGVLDKIPYGSVKISTYTVGSKAHFSCDKGYKLYGEPWRQCLYNGQWGGKYPVCKPIKCGDLDHIQYGGVRLTTYTVGSKAHFYCDKGYKLYGEPWRQCQYNGHWGGKYPVCKPIKCGDLDHIEYGGVNISTYTVGSKAHFYCNKGYKLYGEPWRVCSYDGIWGGKYPVCKPIKCGDLDHIQYGGVRLSTYTVGSKAHFYCNEGYRLYGEPWRQCQYDGKWGGVYPVCKPIKCPELDDIEYGEVRVSSNKVGSRASYYCNKGYKLVGDAHRVCLKTGYWGGMEPVCKPVKCGTLDKIPHGGVRLTTYTVGSKAHFYCDKGYKLYGEPWRQCQYDGRWGGKYPVCKPIKCGDLDKIPYGGVRIPTYTYGSKAHFYCNEGYKLYGDAYRVCQHDGKWGGVYPVCKAIKCPELDDIEYGGVRVSSNKVGSRASYYCNKGYKLVGDAHRVCLKTGYWGGMEPVCKPVKCGDLDKIPYGGVRLTTYTYGSKAHFYCDKGYKLYGEPWRVCQHDGLWGGKYPVCKPIKCGKLDHIKYGSVKISTYTYGSKAHFSCKKGYKLYGEPWRVCQHDGLWGGKYPVCKPIRCPELDNIEYGKVKVTGYTPGSKAIYYCNPYHKLVGDVTRKCLYDGTWSNEEPTCKKILCPTVDPIQYGQINVTGYHPTSKVYYSCDEGYELRGLVWRKCLPSGVWYGKAPVCQKKIVCPHIDAPEYGVIKVSGYYPHSKATYSCNDGYKLYGLSWRKCLPSGVWYGKAPVCKKRIVCPRLVAPDYGSVKVSGYTPSSIASYRCDYGYKLYGLQYRKCLSDGSWYGTDPTCHPVKKY